MYSPLRFYIVAHVACLILALHHALFTHRSRIVENRFCLLSTYTTTERITNKVEPVRTLALQLKNKYHRALLPKKHNIALKFNYQFRRSLYKN
jgi:hypothetical protein